MADPFILIVVFADGAAIQEVYVDTGFAALGHASGTYAAVDPGNSPRSSTRSRRSLCWGRGPTSDGLRGASGMLPAAL